MFLTFDMPGNTWLIHKNVLIKNKTGKQENPPENVGTYLHVKKLNDNAVSFCITVYLCKKENMIFSKSLKNKFNVFILLSLHKYLNK